MITKKRWAPTGDVGGRKEDKVSGTESVSELKRARNAHCLVCDGGFPDPCTRENSSDYALMSVTC